MRISSLAVQFVVQSDGIVLCMGREFSEQNWHAVHTQSCGLLYKAAMTLGPLKGLGGGGGGGGRDSSSSSCPCTTTVESNGIIIILHVYISLISILVANKEKPCMLVKTCLP